MPLDLANLRQFYEDEFEGKTSALCSEPPVTNTVIKMLTEHLGQFQFVLDVGCGANLIYDEFLSQQSVEVVGIDFTWNLLKLAPKPSPAILLQGDAMQLPFADSSFDAVISSETVEHVLDDRLAINEIHRVLMPNGLLFFTVPNLWNAARVLSMMKTRDFKVHLQEGHLREYTSAMVKKLLAQGFEIEKSYPVPFQWSGPLGTAIDLLIRCGIGSRLSKSFALTARKASTSQKPSS